jgi:3-oxoacyl-[acyl-carrier protein] reductase
VRIGAIAVAGDIRSAADLQRAVHTAVETYCGLDSLVLNGGGPPAGTATVISRETIEEAIDLLLRPAVTVIEAALPHLRASGHGRIISISSVSVREPIPNLALSNSVRPGVWGYLKTLSREVGQDGITVNAVAPGRIATARLTELYGTEPPSSELDAIPLGRFGTPRELGALVCFLASQQASYINGALIPIDGGLTRSL